MRQYKLGDKWSNDFDYDGMFKAGSQIKDDATLEDLESLFESFEDVNYHTEARPLYEAIAGRQAGNQEYFKKNLSEFRILCSQCLAD
jgi:hypothetical protein